MRRRNGFRAAALAAVALAATAGGQDAAPRPIFWPLRKIDFPVPVGEIQREAKKPKTLRFYVAKAGERFDLVSEKEPDRLDVLNTARNQRGFTYSVPQDGVYDFAVQFVYADGTTEPRESNLLPEWRVTFDTRPPTLEVRQATATRLEWEAADDHLGPNPVTVETRWPNGKWKAIERKFAARDGYTWKDLRENDPLEVRVIARDRAGLESASRVFSLPGRGDGGRLPAGGFADDPVPARPSTAGFGNPADFDAAGQPPTEYVNRKDLVVQSKLSKVTRSGVRKAYLWVNDGKTGWKPGGALDQTIPGNATDRTIAMPFQAPADGLYGFIVIPESQAGTKQADPVPGTPPQYYVYVDTQPPAVQVKRADAAAGGAVGPRVTIEWTVTEAGSGLLPDSVLVEYATGRETADWKRITPQRVENSGRYTWEVEDKALWQCWVRVSATDRAGNTGTHTFDKPVFLDLEKPAAVIEKVVGSGSAPLPQSSPPPEQPRAEPLFPATPASKPTPVPPAPSTIPDKSPVGVPAMPNLPTGVPPVPPIPK